MRYFCSGRGSWLFFHVHWRYRVPEPELWICTKWARHFYVGMQDSLWYFWILTEGSAVIQTQTTFLRCWPSGPWNISWPVFGGSSAWEGSLCEPRLQDSTITNTEADSDRGALRHFPHHCKKCVCFLIIKINCYNIRNTRVARGAGWAVNVQGMGRREQSPLLFPVRQRTLHSACLPAHI